MSSWVELKCVVLCCECVVLCCVVLGCVGLCWMNCGIIIVDLLFSCCWIVVWLLFD